MSVFIKFGHSGPFHRGDFVCIDLEKITEFKIIHQRNTSEILAITPENHQPDRPYVIAIRDRDFQIQDILKDLQQLKKGEEGFIYEITDTEAHLIKK